MGVAAGFLTRIIVAAGEGRRMGGATKALLRFGEETALSLIARLERKGVEGETIVVTGHDHEAVAAEARRCGLCAVHHPGWRSGQTGSLKAGLAAASPHTTGFLLHPVDLPLVRQEDYDACVAAFVAGTAPIVATSYAMRRGHPVLLASSLKDELLALDDDDPARRVVRAHEDEIVHVTVDNPWVRHDLDTPEDYRAALRALEPR